jgi:hypothetical protein
MTGPADGAPVMLIHGWPDISTPTLMIQGGSARAPEQVPPHLRR